MVTDFHAKNQVNICKRLGKRYEKLVLRTDRRTNRRTECKPKVPFGFAGRGLIRDVLGETTLLRMSSSRFQIQYLNNCVRENSLYLSGYGIGLPPGHSRFEFCPIPVFLLRICSFLCYGHCS